jgi:maltose-binding protein MalE
MKRTKLVALLGMVALLASCGGQTSTPTSTEDTGAGTTTSTVIETTLKIGSPAAQSEFVKGQVEKFLKDNGYSKVTVSMVELGEDKADSAITDWTTGPDVYAFAGDKILSLNQQGALATVPNSKLRKMGTDLSSRPSLPLL